MQFMIDKGLAKDIVPIFSGHEVCQKGHKYGPHTRSYYLIHFCLKGMGELHDRFGDHKISAGEMFIIRPGEITTYIADATDPWEYAWVAFHGDMASVFDTDRSVYIFPMELGLALRDLAKERVTAPAAYISVIFSLIHHLFDEKEKLPDIVEKVKQHIRFNYMEALTVTPISDAFGYERSHLYRIFKERCGLGVKEYIVKTRMEAASILLKKGYSVGNTALAVGYRDPFAFSKAFKQYFGTAPKKKQKNG